MSADLAVIHTHVTDPPPLLVGDVVELPARPARNRSAAAHLHRALRIAGPFALLGLWQLGSSTGIIEERILAAPSTVWNVLYELARTGELWEHISASLGRSVRGLVIGLIIGIGLGLITGLSRLGEELFDSSIQMLRMVPFLALIPLFIVWFGIGEEPKIALIAAACVFPAYINTFSGVRNVDPKLIEAGTVFGLGRIRLTWRIILVNALPSVLVGVRFAMAVSLLALVAAEQVNATKGIGFLVMDARATLRTDVTVAGVVIYAVLGLIVDIVMRILERVLMPWRPAFGGH